MPPTEQEIRAAIARADHALGHTRAVEGQPPAHVLPAAPAAQTTEFTDEDVAAWSQSLGFAKPAKAGRVTTAGD